MGNPQSKHANFSKGKLAVLIRSASNLKNADYMGKSDPYCMCRIGPIGSSWEDKPAETEKCSHIESSTLNPEWNFAAMYTLPNKVAPGIIVSDRLVVVYPPKGCVDPVANLEFHIRILDNDTFNSDDHLGDVRIPLQTLINNKNKATEYNIENGQGTIVVMTGSAVGKAIKDKIKEGSLNENSMWLDSLKQYFSTADDGIVYNATMISFLIAGLKSDIGLRDWFLSKANEDGEWDGPEDSNCTTYMDHDDVVEKLSELPRKFGTNNTNGLAERQNNLGFQKLNGVIWEELDNPVIGLGQTQENHAFVRPYIEKLVGVNGKWDRNMIVEYVNDFFHNKSKFSTSDFQIWTTIVLHKIHLNMEITWEEGISFMEMQGKLLRTIPFEEELINNSVMRAVTGINDTLKMKRVWINRYVRAIHEIFRETQFISNRRVILLASNIMDSILFAGGQSVPSVLTRCVTLLYSKWLYDKLGEDFKLSVNNLHNYVMEVIRYFPPVSGFVYKNRSFGNGPSNSVYLCLHTAQCDKKVWGEDAHEFKLRPMSDYDLNMVGWADRAIGYGEYKNNSRACPGKDLSLVMITEMIAGFIRTTIPGNSGIEGGYSFDSTRWISDTDPADVPVKGYDTASITLTKNRTGLVMTDKQIESIWYDKGYTKFDKVDGNTKSFIAIIKALINPLERESSKVVDVITEKQKFKEEYFAPFGNLRLINHDEENPNPSVQNFIKSIAFNALKDFTFSDKLVWFDSVEEGTYTMKKELLHNLPSQSVYWDDMSSDQAISDICFGGIGQIHVDGVCGEAPENAMYEVNLRYLGKYEVRDKFVRYGHSAYFDKNRALVGIYSCHGNKLYTREDNEWEHIKLCFRSSLVTDMTLKYHLSYTHFIHSNSMMIGARESLSKDHPLRRLLKPHYYRSSVINWAAREILIPLNQLAHRTWAFTDNSWIQLFNDIFSDWEYKPFPVMVKSKRIDVSNLPLYEDGLLLWNCIKKYVDSYLDLYKYTDNMTDMTNMTNEVKDYWKHLNSQVNYGLPELNRENLADHLTNTIWWCTGGHEYAGSIVEYLVHPNGLMPKVCPGKSVADVQTFAQALIIIALTGIRQPSLMDDWKHLFEEKAHDIVESLQIELAKVSDEISDRNKNRKIKFWSMDPRILESSVSI